MDTRCLINGRPGDTLAADDRGLHYGDGLFETLAVRNGACEFWDRHMQRLLLGCERLRIPMPEAALLREEAGRLTQDNDRAVLKILVTRGSGGRGYRVPEQVQATRMLRLSEWPEYPAVHAEAGVRLRLCAQRLGNNPALAGLKHLNRLEQVLARMEWDDPAIADGVMLDQTGQVIEGTFTNVFMAKQGRLLTPRLDQCGVAGVMRGVVMDLAHTAGIDCEERALPLDALLAADEIFLTNSLIGIWPVREFEQWRNSPGTLTRTLQSALERLRQTNP